MSFYDMIPETEMIIPAKGRRGTSRMQQKSFGLIEGKCAHCGQTFYRRSREIEYIRHRAGKELRFCSWTHLCAFERENPPRKKGGSTKTLEERIDFRMRRMIADRLLLDSEAAASMSAEEIKKIKSRLSWDAKQIRELGEELELEAGQSV